MYENITIVVPSFNHGKYLPGLFVRLNKLIDIGVKVYIIDDASKDNSQDIITKFVSENNTSNISSVLKKSNKGLVDSLNTALIDINTEYFYVISSDDLVIPEGFVEAIEYISKNQEKDFVIFGALNVFGDGHEKHAYGAKHEAFFSLPKDRRSLEIYYNHPSPILLQSTIFKSAALRSLNVFNLGLKFDDYPVFIKLFNSEFSFSFKPEIVICKYNHHEENTYKDYKKMYTMFLDVYKNMCPKELYVKSVSQIWFVYFLRVVRDLKLSDFSYFLVRFKMSYLFHLPYFLKNRSRRK